MRRHILASFGAMAVAFAAGCAPAGYDPNDYAGGADAQPAAAQVEASQNAEDAEAEEVEAPELAPEEVTTELIGKSVPRMGRVVTDQDGFVLYRFDEDEKSPPVSNCSGKCAEIWPPVLTDDGEPALDGVPANKVGTLTRADGTKQLTLDGWALYRYIGDEEPGQWTGQGVSGTWFVSQPDGKKNLECLPEGTPKPVQPPSSDADSGAGDSVEESDSDYDYSY